MRKKNTQATLWILWILCLLPMVLAGLLYYSPAIHWLTTKTNGILLRQPISVDALNVFSLEERALASQRWQLWYVVDKSCDKQCQLSLERLQNAQKALGKDRHRVILRTIEPQATLPFLRPGTVAIVDPLNWLMLYYEPDMPYKGMLSDLRRLLKYSHIG
jgi:hypothetical protein